MIWGLPSQAHPLTFFVMRSLLSNRRALLILIALLTHQPIVWSAQPLEPSLPEPSCQDLIGGRPDLEWTSTQDQLTIDTGSLPISTQETRLGNLQTAAGTLLCADVTLRFPAQFELLHRDSSGLVIPTREPKTKTIRIVFPMIEILEKEPVTLVDPQGKTLSGQLIASLASNETEQNSDSRGVHFNRLALGLAMAPTYFIESGARANAYSSLSFRLETSGTVSLDSSELTQVLFDGDISALTLQELGPDDLRTVRFSTRLNQQLAGISGDWSLSAGAGPHFQTMLVTSERFGFRNFAGPIVSFDFQSAFSTGARFSISTRIALDGGFLDIPRLQTLQYSTGFTYRTGTLPAGRQTLWPSEITYEFSHLRSSIRGITMEGETHALGGRWNLL